MGGFCRAVRNRLRAFGVTAWANRTKIAGYIGVVSGAVQMAVAEGQHWQMLLLGAVVAAIGHYNDQERPRSAEPSR
jgi:hypothetical protein